MLLPCIAVPICVTFFFSSQPFNLLNTLLVVVFVKAFPSVTMSFFSKVFGSGKKGEELRGIEELLNKKQSYLEKMIDEELATARKNAKTNKRTALQALKRKKRHEKQLQQIDGTLTTWSNSEKHWRAMGHAAKSLKKAHADMDVDQVHDLMDDIAEQQDVAKEISDAISNPVAFGSEMDDDELEAELLDLQEEGDKELQEELDRQLLDVGPAVPSKLPDVPSAEPKRKQEEDDDMKELAAWAS
ncbi:Charged multivesicular body protein 4b [Caligus rogercresseyi]|uniref:Charged multivesicular body protein 4b n=1 Tax=Caligus rogercresseyi TaxID=217165 RepID=A0A7T8GS30_CALRO|nr:Charged multivesicular body protein 4b [Caligus rogercresseyi]